MRVQHKNGQVVDVPEQCAARYLAAGWVKTRPAAIPVEAVEPDPVTVPEPVEAVEPEKPRRGRPKGATSGAIKRKTAAVPAAKPLEGGAEDAS